MIATLSTFSKTELSSATIWVQQEYCCMRLHRHLILDSKTLCTLLKECSEHIENGASKILLDLNGLSYVSPMARKMCASKHLNAHIQGLALYTEEPLLQYLAWLFVTIDQPHFRVAVVRDVQAGMDWLTTLPGSQANPLE